MEKTIDVITKEYEQKIADMQKVHEEEIKKIKEENELKIKQVQEKCTEEIKALISGRKEVSHTQEKEQEKSFMELAIEDTKKLLGLKGEN